MMSEVNFLEVIIIGVKHERGFWKTVTTPIPLTKIVISWGYLGCKTSSHQKFIITSSVNQKFITVHFSTELFNLKK